MRKLILVLSLFFSSFVLANESDGSIAANDWLKIVDAGEYAESWQNSDALFKSQLSQAQWNNELKGVRTPLGGVISRTKIDINEYSSLPGVPDGKYFVIRFKTEFKNKKSTTETLTFSKKSGHWLPIGYFIK